MAARDRVYEDFEPTSEWVSEPKAEVLLIHLPGFSRDQLRVLLSKSGVLRISGERFLGDKNRWQRFQKEVVVPSNCDTKEISGKFEGGILFLRQPKVIISDEKQQQQQQKDEQQNVAANAKPQDKQPKPTPPAEPQQVISKPQAQPKPEPAPRVKEGFEQGKEQEDKQKKEEVEKKGFGERSQQQGKRNGSLARQTEVVGAMFKKLKKPENFRKMIEYVMLALAVALLAAYLKNYACRNNCKHDF